MPKATPKVLSNEQATPEVATPAVPVAPTEDGPEIVYLSEAARDVKFTINPLAKKYIVNESGMIDEVMK